MSKEGIVLVSWVCPTRNRYKFLPGLIDCFLSQQYDGDMELVILDDSDTPSWIEGSWESRRNVKYSWQPQGLSTGLKRNAANTNAKGDIIIHADDDDWSHPDRTASQVSFLQESGKLLTGYHSYLYYRMSDGAGFKYNQPDFRPHAGGSSMCYWRSTWDKVKFTDRPIGEDFIFTVQVGRENIASEDGCGMLVARQHSGNTCKPNFGSRNFPAVSIDKFPPEFLLTLTKRQE
jgi:glycosyltransferase involved in cell wall biosynthesis